MVVVVVVVLFQLELLVCNWKEPFISTIEI